MVPQLALLALNDLPNMARAGRFGQQLLKELPLLLDDGYL